MPSLQAPVLVLGPLLRYVGETAATIWVETDRACQVEILGRQARTFQVAGHHYALVVIDDLQPGGEHEYQVALDGTVRWPEPDSVFPPSVLRTLDRDKPQRLLFGSCRTAEAEHDPDALAACALGLHAKPRESWPDALFLIGDQVYADEVGPATRQFIEERRVEERRDPSSPPGYEVADFTEYCVLYREAWGEPSVRWLLSVIPTVMIFDDHDVHDDWNISGSWRRDYQAKPWWRSRITGAYMSYWIYQHLGNLSPAELDKDELWRQVRDAGDAADVLSDFAGRADARAEGIRFSIRRDFGRVRVVVIDSRSRRVVEDDGKRLMVDEAEWEWVTQSASVDCDHLVLASSLPVLLPRGIHALEAWNEAVCDWAWGKRFARLGERLRRAFDLEHWAAFGKSFAEFERLLTDLATGSRGEPPASITVIGGDVHHNYLAPVEFPAGINPRSAVHQAVCSPVHNVLPKSFRHGYRMATSRAGEVIATAVARLARARGPRIRWRVTRGPWFTNMVSALEFERGKARILFECATTDSGGKPVLRSVCETDLS
ncbi:MAG TPA: alkaline phosphatase D family protein [Trebonia sp.]